MWSDIFQTEKPGYYGQFGGMFIPEILRATFEELIEAFESARNDPSFGQNMFRPCRVTRVVQHQSRTCQT